MSDQISSMARRAITRVKSAANSLWEQTCLFAEAISGRIRSWSRPKSKDQAIQRVKSTASPADRDTTGNIAQIIDQRKKKRTRPIRRRTRQRVYRLQGYTTVSKINARRKSEKRQRLLRQVLLFLVIILVIILLFNVYNPIRDLAEWYRIIGIKDIGEISGSSTTTTTRPITTTGQTGGSTSVTTTGTASD